MYSLAKLVELAKVSKVSTLVMQSSNKMRYNGEEDRRDLEEEKEIIRECEKDIMENEKFLEDVTLEKERLEKVCIEEKFIENENYYNWKKHLRYVWEAKSGIEYGKERRMDAVERAMALVEKILGKI